MDNKENDDTPCQIENKKRKVKRLFRTKRSTLITNRFQKSKVEKKPVNSIIEIIPKNKFNELISKYNNDNNTTEKSKPLLSENVNYQPSKIIENKIQNLFTLNKSKTFTNNEIDPILKEKCTNDIISIYENKLQDGEINDTESEEDSLTLSDED